MNGKFHVDEMGNVSRGAPLPLPKVIDGIFVTTSRSSSLNNVGNESQIPPPPSGRLALDYAEKNPREFYHAISHAEPVENGMHHGHIMNDGGNNEDEMADIMGQLTIPYSTALHLAAGFHPDDDNALFTTQTPHKNGNSDTSLPRAPGGGVAPRMTEDGSGSGAHEIRNKYGALENAYDSAYQDSGAAMPEFADVTSNIAAGQKLANTGEFNPLEMANAQQQGVLLAQRHKARQAARKTPSVKIPQKHPRKHPHDCCKGKKKKDKCKECSSHKK